MPKFDFGTSRALVLSAFMIVSFSAPAFAETDFSGWNKQPVTEASSKSQPIETLVVDKDKTVKEASQRSYARYTCTPSGFGQKARCYIAN